MKEQYEREALQSRSIIFVRTEGYHQDQLEKNHDGYCRMRPELFEYAKY